VPLEKLDALVQVGKLVSCATGVEVIVAAPERPAPLAVVTVADIMQGHPRLRCLILASDMPSSVYQISSHRLGSGV